MKLVKSLLLGSAAGLAAVSGASAADLGAKKPAPAEYVRVCNAYGAGFFFIPGTQTCLRVSGMARFDYDYSQGYQRGSSQTGMRAQGRIALDARTQTEYGAVRAFLRLEIARRTGANRSGSSIRGAYAFDSTGGSQGQSVNSPAQQYVHLENAFVQFMGFTAGRFQSFFDFSVNSELIGTTAGSFVLTNGLAYTATFGNGFSATLALEDPIERRFGVVQAGIVGGSFLATLPGIPVGIPAFAGANPAATTGGARMPDIVAALRIDQAWGSAQLSGLVHQTNFAGTSALVGVGAPGGTAVGFAPSSKYGFAVQAGVKINLPMIAPGDNFTLNATYGDGAISAVVSNGLFAYLPQGFGIQGVGNLTAADAVLINSGTGGTARVSTSKAWGISASFQHFWTPTVSTAISGSYLKVDYSSAVNALSIPAAGFTANNHAFRDWNYWNIAANVRWTPVAGLLIASEVVYQQVNASGRALDNNKHVGGVAGTPAFTALGLGQRYASKGSAIIGRFRIQRDF